VPLSHFLGDKSLTGGVDLRKKKASKIVNNRNNTIEKRKMLLNTSLIKPSVNIRAKQGPFESADKSPLGVK